MKYLTLREVAERYRVSEVTIGRWWRAGVIPKPERKGRRLLRWNQENMDKHDAEQNAAANGGERVR